MKKKYFIGIDIASETFMVSVLTSPSQVRLAPKEFSNGPAGVDELLAWLERHGIDRQASLVCMEATGVYIETLAYLLSAQDWWLAVQPPLEVKKAFYPTGHKNDRVDSRQIAEYAARFTDRLRRWQPKKVLFEQIQVLLTLREQYVRQKTGHLNANRALKRKFVRTRLAEELHQQSIQEVNHHIETIEAEIEALLKQDPDIYTNLSLLVSIPTVGLLLAAHTLVLMAKMQTPLNSKALAANLGISPYEHSSGSSLNKPATSRHMGPGTMRKLLYLGALSLRTHHPDFRKYFERKVAEGKPKRLVLNNISNKLIKIMCAVIRDQQPYIPNYRSVNPMILN